MPLNSAKKKAPPRGKKRNIKRTPAHDPMPSDPSGRALNDLFTNGWDWIYSPSVEEPVWQTVKQFPLTPIQLWENHQDTACLVGIRPKSQVRWLVVDIDRNSPYHPDQSSEAIDQIRDALEEIGICRIQINQSSHSGGLHIYCPLPEYVSSFWLSVAVKFALETVDVHLKSGECELFPNPKKFTKKGFSNYAAIRLPMQPESGFQPLDEDLHPLAWDLERWLTQFEYLSEQQDMKRLRKAIIEGRDNFKIRKNANPKSISNWESAIESEKAQGWTGPGQTNEKLKHFGCDGRVFQGIDDLEALAEYIYGLAINSPGFHEHSGHTRDIRRRSLEVAQWAMKYYWPYGSDPNRSTQYMKDESNVIDFAYHQKLKEKSKEKIQRAMTRLINQNLLSSKATERANQLIQEAKVSRKTLYQKYNLEYWHPKVCPEPEPTNHTQKTVETQTEQGNLPLSNTGQKDSQSNRLKPLSNKESFQVPNNEGFVDPKSLESANSDLPPQGQRSEDLDQVQNVVSISNWEELKASLSPRLQRKITQKQRQLSFKLDSQSEKVCTDQTSEKDSFSNSFSGAVEASQCDLASIELRRPSPVERKEFESWYELAQEFGLVSDFEWQFNQYFVFTQGSWLPFYEISATFTSSKLMNLLDR